MDDMNVTNKGESSLSYGQSASMMPKSGYRFSENIMLQQ
jgi:hypothetical protein